MIIDNRNNKFHYKNTVESKSVTRTINIHHPDGHLETIQNTAIISRNISFNPKGVKDYGGWSHSQWKEYKAPIIVGYRPNINQVPAEKVNITTTEKTIDIIYKPIKQQITVNYLNSEHHIVGTQMLTGFAGETIIPQYRVPKGYELTNKPQRQLTFTTDKKQIIQVNVHHKIIESNEVTTKTRTINVNLPNSKIHSYHQIATVERNIKIDTITGDKTYGPWNNSNWSEFKIPNIVGYTPNKSKINKKEVTHDTTDETINIYYITQ